MQVNKLKKKNRNQYLIFGDYASENKALIKKYVDVWDGIKNEIKAINSGEENNYGKDYMKVKFNSDDDLPLNKPLKFHAITIIIKSTYNIRDYHIREFLVLIFTTLDTSLQKVLIV